MKTERITSRQNPLLVHLRKLLSSRAYRTKHREFAADGTKLLWEAIRWGAPLKTVILTAGAVDFEIPDGVRIVEVPEDVMSTVSVMEAPQGAIFICGMPQERDLQITSGSLILDGLQDPGNVGTILRTADAFDIPVILSSGCADLYNPKTVRATMGALFRMNVQCASRQQILQRCGERNIPIYSTALTERAMDLRRIRLDGAVVIGSEGNGVCSEFLQASEKEIIIPMSARCESLNAASAATVVMWEMMNRK